jgi:hypothetical protein
MTQTENILQSMPPNPYPFGSQKYRIYKRFSRYGRVKDIEIVSGLGGPPIYNSTGRCSEIRAFLKSNGIILPPAQRVNNISTVFEYVIGGRA